MPKKSEANQTPENLDAVAAQLVSCAEQVRSVAEAMRTAKVEELIFTHFDSFKLGVTKVLSYTGAAHKRVFAQQLTNSDFGVQITQVKKRGRGGARAAK